MTATAAGIRRLRFGTLEDEVDAGDAHRLALHVGGICRLERPVDGRWRSFHLAPGDLSIAPAGGDGRFRNTGEAEILALSLPAAALAAAREDLGTDRWSGDLTGLTGLDDPLAKQLILTIWREAESGSDATATYRRAAEWMLALQLVRLVGTSRARSADRSGLPDWRLRRALAFMEARLADGFALPELAAELGLSVSHLCAQFRAATGRSVMRHFALMRLECARNRLLASKLTVAAIAEEVGFSTPAHFGHAFRIRYDASPAAYRRERGASAKDRA